MPLAILGWDPSIFTHMMNISQRHNKKPKKWKLPQWEIFRLVNRKMWCTVGVVSAGKNGLRSTRNLLGEKSSFSFLCYKYSIGTIWKMLPNRNFCTYCGWPVEDNYPVGALCLALFLFPIGIIPCCLLKVSHSQPVPALSCLDVKSKLALPCLVSSCLVLPRIALSWCEK